MIRKIARLITEDPDIPGDDDDFDVCPSCGSKFAMVSDDGAVSCPRRSCENYDAGYAKAVIEVDPGALPDALLSPNNAARMKRWAAAHGYTGQSGTVVMRRGKVGHEDEWTPEEFNEDGAVIHFDDYIDRGDYVVLFAKTRGPQKDRVTHNYAYMGKYMFLEWRWPSPRSVGEGLQPGDPGCQGDAIRTKTHDTLPCMKYNIKRMVVGNNLIIDQPFPP